MTSAIAEPTREGRLEVLTRLLVTVRDPQDRRYRPIGFLTHESRGYCFAYLQRELDRPAFRPLPGLARAAGGAMCSDALFPIFAERVISARRPDREQSMAALGLPTDAAPFEVLVRSHGQRVGDTIELLPAPAGRSGEPVSFTFLAHGVRHLPDQNQDRIATLVAGERLRLRREQDNPINPRARLVTDTDDLSLGWVPEPLIDVVDQLEEPTISVEQSNGPEVGFHFRLLARLTGAVRVGGNLFDGPEWAVHGS